MKKFSYLVMLLFITSATSVAQRAVQTISDPMLGNYFKTDNQAHPKSVEQPTATVDILWHKAEATATVGDLFHSDGTHKNYLNWQLNDQRVALHGNTNIAEWEFATDDSWAINHSNEAGTAYLVVDDTHLNILKPESGESITSIIFPGRVLSAIVRQDGEGFFVAYNNEGSYSLAAYELTGTTPIWAMDNLPNNIVSLATPLNDQRLLVAFAAPEQHIWVLNPATGTVIQDNIDYYNNSPSQAPALSADGEFLAFGDFTGMASFLQWNGTEYELLWKANLAGPGSSSTWGMGQAISADGSLIAFGTLDFVSNGYNGSLFLFNKFSSEPVWVYENVGDEVCQVSMSDDGSLIAGVSYGPLNHSTADFFLFRKQSNVPIGEINTAGSLFSVDMAGDGSTCLLGGKAVHAREMGNGGNVYYINCIPADAGSLQGSVHLTGNTDHGGVMITIEGIDDYFETTTTDGSYIIKYVPAGTYSVNFTMPGYYPQTIDNIVITEGEATTLNVEMEATGTAISQLIASQGAYDHVRLIWPEYTDAFTGYNIYRKNAFDAPFGAPIASIGTDQAEFLDETAIPTRTYYYTVTAQLSASFESPYSNVAQGYVSTTAIVNEIDVYMGSAPTIDGIKSPGEWDDAFRIDVSNYLENRSMGSVFMYFKMDDDYLYVCSENYLDHELHESDGIAFYIDDNNDGSFPESGNDSEGNYWMYYGASGSTIRYRPIYNTGGVGDIVYLPEQIIAFSLTDDCQTAEFALPFGTEEDWHLKSSADNKSGLFLFVRDASISDWDGKWPAHNDQYFVPTYYGVMNYRVVNEVPPAPVNLRVDEDVISEGLYAPVSWDMPPINDLGYFNVFLNSTTVTHQTQGTQIILDVEENTEYSVFVTTVDASGQESEPSETLTFTTGFVNVAEMQASSFVLFPNPTTSTITINSEINEGGSVKVINLAGQLVESFQSSNLQHTQLSVENYKKGAYFVLIHYSDTIVVRKFVVQ